MGNAIKISAIEFENSRVLSTRTRTAMFLRELLSFAARVAILS